MPTSTLTESQKLTAFDILDVPYATSYAAVTGMGEAYVQVANQPILSAAKNAILSFLDSISGTGTETDCKKIINDWQASRWNVGTITNGGPTDMNGLSYSWEARRNIQREEFKRRVPYYKYHEILARQQGECAGSSAPISSIQILR